MIEPDRAMPAPDEDRGSHHCEVMAAILERGTRVRHQLADTADAVAATCDRIAAGRERAVERGRGDAAELRAHAVRARRFAAEERREAARLRAEPAPSQGKDPERKQWWNQHAASRL